MVIGPNLLPWNRRYALKSYVSGSMWLVPLFALLVYTLFHRFVHAIDVWLVARMGRRRDSFLACRCPGRDRCSRPSSR